MQTSGLTRTNAPDLARSTQPAVGLNPKVTFGFLLGLSVLTLGLGFWQIGRSIKAPFELAALNNAGNVSGQSDGAVISALRSKDTDQDGLYDYDEFYTYQTSPYLPDSDSDGQSDGDEVLKGSDPNCPVGQNCRGVLQGGEEASQAPEMLDPGAGLIPQESFNGPEFAPAEEAGDDVFSLDEFLGQTEASGTTLGTQVEVTPQLLRELLLKSGQVDVETLSGIDDETLMRVYQETVSQQQ